MVTIASSSRDRVAPAFPTRHWSPRLILGAVAYVPLLLTHRGMVGADTKQYLYLDPGKLISRATSMWDPNVGMGTVTHENIGYLFPMGPWYWALHTLGIPTWIAQRLWTGTLLFAAGTGVLFLLRTLDWRGRTDMIAALAYMLSPYLLEYEARISAILMPWAALPWLVALTVRAVRNGGWRVPAIFAIVAAAAGSVNATGLIYAGIGPVLLLPFMVWVTREATVRRALATAVRIAALTLVCSSWWIVGLATQAGYGMNVLRFTETIRVVSTDAIPVEALRGLGNWFFYGRDTLSLWVNVSFAYTQWLWLLAVTFALPVLAFVAAVCIRWRYKLYFLVLILSGVILTTLVNPYPHPSPVGSIFKSFANTSTFGLALRSTPRSVPLIALGTSVLLAGGVSALAARFPRRAAPAAAVVVALVLAAMYPLWTGNLIDNNLQRPEQIPAYWTQAAAYLNGQSSGTRVLELPGADFSHYRWGTTLDPVTPGLMDRPFVGRELIPYGSPPSADLLIALDRRLQEGSFDPSMLAPIARLMSAGDVLLRSDLQYERFSTPRPRPTWALFSPVAPPGLIADRTFGPLASRQTSIPVIDELTLGVSPNLPDPPNIATFAVPAARPILRAESAARPTIVAGSGDGLVDAATAGLLDTNPVVLYSATLDSDPAGFAAAMANGADLVLTDSNRRRAERWGTVGNTSGYTERAGETPIVDPSDNRLIVFPGTGDYAATVTVQRGGLTVSATGYGNAFSYAPSERPANAFDGDPKTAWTTAAAADPRGQELRVDLAQPTTTDHINLVQPLVGSRDRSISRVTVSFDGNRSFQATLGPPSHKMAGQTLTFPQGALQFQHLVIRIDAVASSVPGSSGSSGVGFAEVRIGDPAPVLDELVRLPVDLLQNAGAASAAHRLVLVLTRVHGNPAQPFQADDEAALKRLFSLPTARSFSLGGTARIDPNAPQPVLSALLDAPAGASAAKPPLVASASSSLPDLNTRPANAIDNNAATAWTTPLGDPTGQLITVNFAQPTNIDHLDLAVVADGRHSVPTQLRVRPGGGAAQVVAVPTISDQPGENAVSHVRVTLPVPLSNVSSLRVTLTGVRKVQTHVAGVHTLPVAIADLGLPVHLPDPAAVLSDACRTDLLRVDGQPVGLRITGSRSDAVARGPLAVTPCGPNATLLLGPGEHVLEARPGHQTGIDLDRLVLASERGGAALALGPNATVPPPAPTPAPAVQVLSQGRASADLAVDVAGQHGPLWLVLGQSFNRGWTARVDGMGRLGPSQLVDGIANGWLVHPPNGATRLVVHLSWAPQHRVAWGLRVSAVALLGCLLVGVLARRRRRLGADLSDLPSVPLPRWVWPGQRRATMLSWPHGVVVAVIAAVGSGGLIGPVPGLIVGGAALAVARRPRLRPWLALASVGGLSISVAFVLAFQAYHRPRPALNWATHFGASRIPSWMALALLLVDAVVEHLSPHASLVSPPPEPFEEPVAVDID